MLVPKTGGKILEERGQCLRTVPDHWLPLVIYLASAMVLIGSIPALVFMSGFAETNPWVSFIFGITVLISIFVALSYLDHPRAWSFIAILCATVLVTVLGLTSSHGTGSIAEIASVSFFAAGPLGGLNLARRSPWAKWAVVATMVTIGVVYCVTLWGFPQQLTLYLSLLGMAWIGTGIIRRWLLHAIMEHEGMLADLEVSIQAGLELTEREAQRRFSARQLHDTVLSTLTMLAHSGKGIDPDALRAQANSDAEFLTTLRNGYLPHPQTSHNYLLEPMPEPELSQTLENVRSRFQSSGLEVIWRGDGKLLLPRNQVDTLIAAISECLENVRRHSQSTSAFVTVSVEETLVRVIIADQGIGFDQHRVTSGLGLKQSVIARIEEIGGNVKIFSEPGVGTTVILEAPVE